MRWTQNTNAQMTCKSCKAPRPTIRSGEAPTRSVRQVPLRPTCIHGGARAPPPCCMASGAMSKSCALDRSGSSRAYSGSLGSVFRRRLICVAHMPHAWRAWHAKHTSTHALSAITIQALSRISGTLCNMRISTATTPHTNKAHSHSERASDVLASDAIVGRALPASRSQ